MEKKQTEIKNLKDGSFILLDDVPCRVDSIQLSKSGKHGAAKARLVARGIFTDVKKSVVYPGDTKMDVPVIEKKSMQVIAFISDHVQLMDLQDYSTIELAIPDEFKGQLKEGDEVLVWAFGSYAMIKGRK